MSETKEFKIAYGVVGYLDGYLLSYLVIYSVVTQRENKALIVSPMTHKKLWNPMTKEIWKRHCITSNTLVGYLLSHFNPFSWSFIINRNWIVSSLKRMKLESVTPFKHVTQQKTHQGGPVLAARAAECSQKRECIPLLTVPSSQSNFLNLLLKNRKEYKFFF